MLGLFGAAFGYSRFLSLGTTVRTDPYYMDFSIITLGRGYGWYFDRLHGMNLRWGAWFIIVFLLTILFLYWREKRGLFFLGYISVALLPVIFMINHRLEFFWYVPFCGVAGLMAVFIQGFEKWGRRYVPETKLAPLLIAGFVLMVVAHCWRESLAAAEVIQDQKSYSVEYERFVEALRDVPPPSTNATIYFRAIPSSQQSAFSCQQEDFFLLAER
jgi:hypothetical protein